MCNVETKSSTRAGFKAASSEIPQTTALRKFHTLFLHSNASYLYIWISDKIKMAVIV